MKLRSIVAAFVALGFIIYVMVLFFKTYNYWYLFSAVLLPVIVAGISSAYFLPPLFGWGLALSGVLIYFLTGKPYDIVALSFSVFMLSSRVMRKSENFDSAAEGFYSEIKLMHVRDAEKRLVQSFISSKFYQENKNLLIDDLSKSQVNQLLEQMLQDEKYTKEATLVIEFIFPKKYYTFFTIDTLLRIHAFAMIKMMPISFVKERDFVWSIGTKVIIDVVEFFTNSKKDGLSKKTIEDRFIQRFIANSTNTQRIFETHNAKFGIVKEDEVEHLRLSAISY